MTEQAKVPAIRFAGFTDPWEQRKLGEIVDVCSGRDYKHLSKGPIPVYGTGGYMTSVSEGLSYEEDAIGIGRKGTIDHPYRLNAPFWTVDTLFYSLPNQGIDLDFTLCVFLNVDWKSKDESTGLPSLSKQAINETKIWVPSGAEQRAIGAFFSRLDDLITLHQRKYDKLVIFKKSMLEKMFPKDGESVPEIRFAGFTDPWEQRKLSEVATFGGGHTPPMADPDNYEDGYVLWVTSQDVKSNYLDRTTTQITEKGAKELTLYPAGSLVMVTRSGILRHTLPVAELRKPSTVNQDIRVILPQGECCGEWLLQFFISHNKELLLEFGKTGTTVESVDFGKIKDMLLYMPSTVEQQQIGDFFAKLDSLITLHQRKLELLQDIKKSLLDKMFV
ncbi:restriction endonuclease subunit S [Bifidobacterium longum]|uniref:Restriction endonuclease S subunit n=1 Tax=Bifidobacterium longum subsp. longum TaxID=1679 RepID=A0A4V2N0T9_BIFLL|nr:restriction endonuclease S subunit [Bifidobacterium longum subsp. longum]